MKINVTEEQKQINVKLTLSDLMHRITQQEDKLGQLWMQVEEMKSLAIRTGLTDIDISSIIQDNRRRR